MTNDDAAIDLVTDPILQHRLAKYVAMTCFRNSLLDDLHSGTVPASKAGDFTDVVVQTPYGEIPWNNLSRIDNIEMKTLMMNVFNKTYQFVQDLFNEQRGGE